MAEDKPLEMSSKAPVMTPAKRFVMDALRARVGQLLGQDPGPTFHADVGGLEVVVREDGWTVCDSGGARG